MSLVIIGSRIQNQILHILKQIVIYIFCSVLYFPCRIDFQGQLSVECNQVILTFPLQNGHFRILCTMVTLEKIQFFQSGNIFHLTRIFTYLNWGKHKQLNNRISRLNRVISYIFCFDNMNDKTTLSVDSWQKSFVPRLWMQTKHSNFNESLFGLGLWNKDFQSEFKIHIQISLTKT